ncbi:mucin-5AC-like [Schistocerca nitens]|uniref:mucin-5AC-like n=1 Tax=Schistocerca nitens TaxID=7011 RepID=UPI0021191F20|nr:mucin-5AC-like [Schistocerca nitens]
MVVDEQGLEHHDDKPATSDVAARIATVRGRAQPAAPGSGAGVPAIKRRFVPPGPHTVPPPAPGATPPVQSLPISSDTTEGAPIMGSRILMCAVLAVLLALPLETPAAAGLSRGRRFAEEEGDDDSWAVRTFSQRGRPAYQHHGTRDADEDAAAEESVRQVEVQAAQRSTPGPRYLPTPSARRKEAGKHDGKPKSTPGPKYLPTPSTTAYTDADDVTKATRQETTWYTETSSHVRSSTTRSDIGSTVSRAAPSTTQEISNDVRTKPSQRRGRVRYRSTVSETRTRNSPAPRASRRRTTHSTTASSVDEKIATPEGGFGRVQSQASVTKRVTDSVTSTTTSKPQSNKPSTSTPAAQNASANKSSGTNTPAKKSKQDTTVHAAGTLESQQIPASFWKSLREELLNTAAEEGAETKKEVRETKDSASTEKAATNGKEVKAKGSAEANSSSTKSCSHSSGEEKGNHTVAPSRRKANESSKASAAPRPAVTKAANHASSKAPAVTAAKSSQSTAGRQASAKDSSTPTSGGTTPLTRETSTSPPERKQPEPQKQEASAKKAEPAADAKRPSEATTAGTVGQQKVTPAAS